MTKADIICKDLNMITNNIRDSLFDAYEQGMLDGYKKGREEKADAIEDIYNIVISDIPDKNKILKIQKCIYLLKRMKI